MVRFRLDPRVVNRFRVLMVRVTTIQNLNLNP